VPFNQFAVGTNRDESPKNILPGRAVFLQKGALAGTLGIDRDLQLPLIFVHFLVTMGPKTPAASRDCDLRKTPYLRELAVEV
jgi:hypothetical protein